jgi:hypothetical protein
MTNESADKRKREAEKVGETNKRLNREGEKPRHPGYPEQGRRDDRLGND